jgi:alpha-1,2-rhamnosyltransferase
MTSEGEHNLLVCNTKFTLPEIPSSNTQISIYEALLETKATYVQVVLYDFIPFFHAWTVHPQNRGHLNSYVRIVLLADRIVAISQLVEEQAKLITKAFRLERKQWISRKVEFDYLPLPSGLTSMTGPPISKIENLVVMLGSIEPRKNHLEFLYAIEILHNRGVPVIAELIGSAGWENDHILSKLENLQAKGISVRRLANLNDSQVKTRIAQARVLLQISEAEGFGLPVLEALTLGTKVIVSDIRPLNDIESPYITKIDLGRPDCVANAISEAISSSVQEKIVPPNSPSWETWHKLLYSD